MDEDIDSNPVTFSAESLREVCVRAGVCACVSVCVCVCARARILLHVDACVFSVRARALACSLSLASCRSPHFPSLTFVVRAQYFTMPLVDAARKMGICATAIKKVCG
jgi:hypothetical protein